MKVVAILHRSAGNDAVGDMWRETGVFELETPVKDIFQWAANQLSLELRIEEFRSHLEITVDTTPTRSE